MYWIYLILFILAVLTPDLVQHGVIIRGVTILEEERAEEVLIFFLGALGFMIFLWKEKQLIIKTQEKSEIQKEVSMISKDLTDTYSYIGEVNRKIDILKEIALGLSEVLLLTPEKEKEIYNSIIHAINIFSKSSQISISFIDIKSGNCLKEIKSNKRVSCAVNGKDILKKEWSFIETDRHFLVKSPRSLNGIIACIAIIKRNSQQKLEDPELIEALASQALFLFNLTSKSGINPSN